MTKRLITIVLFFAYCGLLLKVMVFKDLGTIRIGTLMLNFGGTHEGPPNLIPLRTILSFLTGGQGLIIAGINLIGNIVLLVPVGFLLALIFSGISQRGILFAAVAAGLILEGSQVVFHVGIFDVDDVILNGIGVLIGHWAATGLPVLWRSTKARWMIITAMVVVSALALFLVVDFFRSLPDHPGPRRQRITKPSATHQLWRLRSPVSSGHRVDLATDPLLRPVS